MKTITFIADDYEYLIELERRYLENNSYQTIIAHLMETHKTDASFLKSPIWEAYMLEFQSNLHFYEMEKKSFGLYIENKLVNEYNVDPNQLQNWSWEIVDFSFKEVIVSLQE